MQNGIWPLVNRRDPSREWSGGGTAGSTLCGAMSELCGKAIRRLAGRVKDQGVRQRRRRDRNHVPGLRPAQAQTADLLNSASFISLASGIASLPAAGANVTMISCDVVPVYVLLILALVSVFPLLNCKFAMAE